MKIVLPLYIILNIYDNNLLKLDTDFLVNIVIRARLWDSVESIYNNDFCL